jgi:hypothetical protein
VVGDVVILAGQGWVCHGLAPGRGLLSGRLPALSA